MTVAGNTQERLARVGYGLSAAAAVSIVFIVAPSNDAVRLVKVTPVAALVLLVVAVLGVLGARTGRSILYLTAGGLAVAAGVLQLAQFGRATNWVGGNGSTAALLAGLGIGFCALWYANRSARQSE